MTKMYDVEVHALWYRTVSTDSPNSVGDTSKVRIDDETYTYQYDAEDEEDAIRQFMEKHGNTIKEVISCKAVKQ